MNRRNRNGFTLLETIGLAIVIAGIFAASSQVLNSAYQSHHRCVDYLARTEVLAQVYNRMYRDSASAVKCVVTNGALIFTAKEALIRYEVREQELYRIRYRQGAEQANSPKGKIEILGSESWPLPDGSSFEWKRPRGKILEASFDSAVNGLQTIEWKFALEALQ